MLRNKTFAPEFCSLKSNWLAMREQAPGANLLHESISGASSLVCTEICLREMTCLQLASQIGLFFSSTTHCVELTFKMAAEGVEEDSVQIIDNKKSEETSWYLSQYKTSNRPLQRTLYSTIKSVKTGNQVATSKVFSPILVKFKNTITIEEIKKRSLKESGFSFSIQSCSPPCWIYNKK